MDRLTVDHWGNLDDWECCGQDYYCKREGFEKGGCHNGCIVPKIYRRLAAYEDTGLTPEEITAMIADNKRLHDLIDILEGTIKAL